MQLVNAPSQLVLPWGNGDSSKTNPIPVPSQIGVTPGAASWTDGFPPLCATPVNSGGVPPAKADMNGGLFQMSAVDVWMCAGGGFPYNSAFSAAIGGYPLGARVVAANGLGYWRSVVDNNTSDPDTGGTGWIQDSEFPLNVVTYSATPVFDASKGTTFQITLAGNVTSSTLINLVPGMRLVFMIWNVGIGAPWSFAWPANVNGGNIPAPGQVGVYSQEFTVDSLRRVNLRTPLMIDLH